MYNFGILISISIISGFVAKKSERIWHNGIIQGLLFGGAAIIGMVKPLVVAPGLIFDGRSVMISLVSMYFGPWASLIAASMALIYRVSQGGPGATMGVLVITSSAIIGVIFYFQREIKDRKIIIKELFLMGLIVHGFMIVFMLTIPGKGVETIKVMGLPVIIMYPLATIVIGIIMDEVNERRRISESLLLSQQKLSESNMRLENSNEELITTEEELRKQYIQIAESEDAYRSIFELSADTILILDGDKIRDCNQAACDFFGVHEKKSILGKTISQLSPINQAKGKTSKQKAIELINEFKKKKKLRFDWIHLNGDGVEIPTEIIMSFQVLKGENLIQAILRDMTIQKKLENKLEYMSYHDQLTGLYNRRFSEIAIDQMDTFENLPLTIMVGDVNGLKLINDSFGHVIGDKLLIKVSKIIESVAREQDSIARVGGDEFVLILPRTSSLEAENLANQISKLSSLEQIEAVQVSVSLGWETKISDFQKIPEIMKKAEDHLYKRKLLEGPSIRGKTIQTILCTLHEKNKREEEHSYRVSSICENMGIALEMGDTHIKELKQVGLLHDIGKIAIDEAMLNKEGKLTEEEWIEITRHPEIGYRILSTVNEMAEIACFILAHHERWDGGGYPKGLRGEEIPLQSRIIALADSFDAMISDRAYRKAMRIEDALEEIRKNAGTQFDPMLAEVFLSNKEIY